MQLPRNDIEKSLPTKGFVKEETHHTYFYHEYEGKRTGAYTYTSRGTTYKTYGVQLIARMKVELKLDKNGDVFDLCSCPMSGQDYNEILRRKGMIPTADEAK